MLVAALCLGGCDRMGAAFTPATDRINAAFPLPDELQTASTRLVASLEADKPAQQLTADHLDKLLKVRALTCTATSPVGRFDTAAKIKGKVTDLTCFKQQDTLLDEWIALRRVGMALRDVPLYPLAPLPAKSLLPNFAEHVSSVLAAADANVLVVRGQQRFMAVQLPGGKQFSSFPIPEQTSRQPSLSPNGRLLAVPVSKGLRILEVATGNLLWSTDKYTDVIAWLPKVDVVVLTQAGTSSPQFLDARRGTLESYPAAEKSLTWSLLIDGGKLLVGSASTVSLMEHTRAANGAMDIVPVKQWTLPGYRIGGVLPHLLSQGKKLVYAKGSEIGWLNLESGEQGAWQVFGTSGTIAKVSDTAILFDSNMPGETPGITAGTQVLDVEKMVIATAKDLEARDGQLFSLGARTGYLKRGNNAVVIGGSVEGENPRELDRAVADALLAQQLAKLNDPTALPVEGRTPERQAYYDTLSKQVRAMNTANAIRDGLPRDVVEAIRQGRGPNSLPGQTMPTVKPMLTNVPENARLSIIGVYEAEGATPRPGGGGNRMGTIKINVAPGSTPVVLALSSYEPVTWMISNSGGRKISAILVSGYYDSTVIGQGNAQVLKIGSTHAYKMESPEYVRLKQDVGRYVSNPVQTFQGGYKGREFGVQ